VLEAAVDTEQAVAEHYTKPDLESAILAGVAAAGIDPEHFEPDDLAAVDQFHVGGAEAAEDVARGAGISSGMRVLDIGAGIGGPARLFAHRFGAIVQGVDLTPSFVTTAQSLTRRCGLTGQVSFSKASGLDLPFSDSEFDAATMMHVGMNVEHKDAVFREVHRVLRRGGVFAVYDIMVTGDGEPQFPLPWAASVETSFLRSPRDYVRELEAAGFTVTGERNRHGFALEFLTRAQARLADNDPRLAGMQVVLGAEGPVRMGHLVQAIRAGTLAPVEIFSRRDGA
jgi:cyclopropane fatty-acyl-phospholipid synthase-like methyltransferase